jgi:hypothetical protein
MIRLRFPVVATLCIVLLSAMVQTSQASAQEPDSKVSTNFQANDFGLWSNSSLYGQIYNGSTELAKWTQLW